ncbi:MAG: nucleotidyltransferase domain-containing protein [Peptococcaceae bacterium]|nr:nucleotidyltransferase domain-containing protein [Peptococcaceae bacterium]
MSEGYPVEVAMRYEHKDLIEGAAYAFLRSHPDLRNMAYLVISGSRGYGTATDTSDVDLRGFVVEDKKYLLGCNSFEQFEDSCTDTVLYGLKKFFCLCRGANPNVLELLGADEDCVVVMNEVGRKVRDSVEMFVSKRVIGSFGNYATAQLRRLQNALCHDQLGVAQQEFHLRDTLMGCMEHFNRMYTGFDKNAIRLYLREEGEVHNLPDQRILMDINLEGYPLRDFVGIYSEMRETVRNYEKLNHRNRKKDEVHLCKHAMHLVRLLMTGTDILRGRGIITKRQAEHELLMDIRNGFYGWPEFFDLAERFRADFEEAARNTKLPDEPDDARIEALQMEIFEGFM